MNKNYVNPCKVITGVNTPWSYANVWEPKSINGGTPKYSVSLIIPKSDTKTVEKVRAAIKAAYQEGEGKLKGNSRVVPALEAIKNPLRDGDLERPGDDAYKDSFFINANSASQPGIVDAHCQHILERSEVYSGGVWPCLHQLLCLQQQWQQRHCLQPEQPAEDSGRGTPGRQTSGRRRLCYSG